MSTNEDLKERIAKAKKQIKVKERLTVAREALAGLDLAKGNDEVSFADADLNKIGKVRFNDGTTMDLKPATLATEGDPFNKLATPDSNFDISTDPIGRLPATHDLLAKEVTLLNGEVITFKEGEHPLNLSKGIDLSEGLTDEQRRVLKEFDHIIKDLKAKESEKAGEEKPKTKTSPKKLTLKDIYDMRMKEEPWK